MTRGRLDSRHGGLHEPRAGARANPSTSAADIWAFGCVLYEMLTGKPAFLGEDVTSTLARVLEVGANFAALPARVSPAVRRTLELCLEKDLHKRIADMRDVKLALAGAFATSQPDTHPPARSALPVAAVAAAAVLLGGAGAWFLKPSPAAEQKSVVRFDYPLPAGVDLRDTMTSVLGIAPSGELIAFNGTGGIYVRRLGETEARLLPGTAPEGVNAVAPDVVVSPDGREVAFFRGPPGRLMKTAIDGGTPIVLTEIATAFPFGLTWEPDGTLYYGQIDGIWRVSANGGTPERLIETKPPEQAYRPQLLPGGQWLLFTLAAASTGPDRWNGADIVIQSLRNRERRVLRSGAFDARYLPTGHVTYMADDVLFASTFDAETLTLGAERVPVVQDVRTATPLAGGSGFYAVSNNGTLAFIPRETATAGTARARKGLAWIDRAGNVTPLPVRPDDYTMARLSPDGTKIALVVGGALPVASVAAADIYLFDIEAESLTQVTFNPETDDGPVWSRDGRRIYYRAYRQGGSRADVYMLPADGGTSQLVGRSETTANPLPWSLSPDDSTLMLVDAVSFENVNLSTLDLGTDGNVKPLLTQAGITSEPSLSPNGQWLVSHENGSADGTLPEITLRPFPGVGQQRRPVATGVSPVFSADGSELFFFDGEGLSVAAVQYAPFRVGNPRTLFRGPYWWGVGGPDGALGRAWDVDSRNDRFLVIAPLDQSAARSEVEIKIVLNWFEELERRVPTPRRE